MRSRQRHRPSAPAAVVIVAALLAAAAGGAGDARAEAGFGATGLTLSFAAVDGAVAPLAEQAGELDLGRVSALPGGRGTAGQRRGVVVSRRVAIRLDAPAGGPPVARLEAALVDEPAGWSVRVDGLPLSTLPRVVDPVHRMGSAVVHLIEITVPPDAPEGALESTILWTADSGG